MTYIVHGATGAQGAPVAAALAKAGKSVTAAVRNAETYTEGPAVSVDFTDTATLVDAYTGAEGVFIHLPMGSLEQQYLHARAIVEAVRKARPARVVFSTSGFDHGKRENSPHGMLMRGILDAGVSSAVIAPRLYLENLLLPPVVASVQEHGVLPYPIRTDYRVSWSSHLDIADIAVQLFDKVDITGSIAVGALPALIGDDIAAGFAAHLKKSVVFRSQTPDEFAESLIPIFGVDSAMPVVESYRGRYTQHDDIIDKTRSAQTLLGLRPRSVATWLHDIKA